jgi:DNA-directed RNA polymerase specialized sigma24 family protein
MVPVDLYARYKQLARRVIVSKEMARLIMELEPDTYPPTEPHRMLSVQLHAEARAKLDKIDDRYKSKFYLKCLEALLAQNGV